MDDASTDSSVAFVAEHYPEVKIVQLARNSGLAVGCNAGARAAAGELLVMLNNDTEAEPGWLAALVEAAMVNPQAGAIASKMLLFDRRDTLHNAGDTMGVDGIPRNRGVWEVDRGQFDAQPEIFGGCGGGVMYRRAAWEQTGGFDERLFMYLEDVDLAWRLQLLGWGAVFAPGGAALSPPQRDRRRGARQLLRGPQHDLGHRQGHARPADPAALRTHRPGAGAHHPGRAARLAGRIVTRPVARAVGWGGRSAARVGLARRGDDWADGICGDARSTSGQKLTAHHGRIACVTVLCYDSDEFLPGVLPVEKMPNGFAGVFRFSERR